MSWTVRWQVINRPTHLDRGLAPGGQRIIQGETVEFQVTSTIRDDAVYGRQTRHWSEPLTLTVTDTTTAGPFPAQPDAPLFIRHRFAHPGHKRLHIAGVLRRPRGEHTRTSSVRLEPVHVRLELDVLPDPLSERGRVGATSQAATSPESRAIDRLERSVERAEVVRARTQARADEERRRQFRQRRAQRLSERGLRSGTPGILTYPFLTESQIRQLTDDETAVYLYGLATAIEVTPPLNLQPLAGTEPPIGPGRLPEPVIRHFRIRNEDDGTVATWRQSIARDPHVFLDQRESEHRRFRGSDNLVVRYSDHGPVGVIRADQLAHELTTRALQGLIWQVVEIVVVDLVVRIVMPPAWAALRVMIFAIRRVIASVAETAVVAVARGTAEILTRALQFERFLAEREASVLLRAAAERRGAGGVSAATEQELVEFARRHSGLIDEATLAAERGTAGRVPRRPLVAAETTLAPELAPAAVPGGAGALMPPRDSFGTLVAVLRRELQDAMRFVEVTANRLRRATAQERGILMERIGMRLLNRWALAPLRSIRVWRTGRLTRPAGYGADAFGVGTQARGAAAEGWAAAGARARGSGSFAERFTVEGSNQARLGAPTIGEFKTGNVHQTLSPFGSGYQMDVNFAVDRYIRWMEGEGASTVRAWVRDRRLHPYWTHAEWIRSAPAREIFRQNRVVIVFSGQGNAALTNAGAAALADNQIVRVAVEYLE